jgi:hypothetical protein
MACSEATAEIRGLVLITIELREVYPASYPSAGGRLALV